MSTSGVSTFNLDLNNIVEEAFERCGLELRTGYDLKTARRSMNLLSMEWANRGINLWTVDQQTIVMNTGQPIYPLPVDTVDILDAVIRTQSGSTYNQIDINISRIAEPTYMAIPNKLTTGRPIQVYVNRQSAMDNATTITLANTGIGISATDTSITLSSVDGLSTTGFIQIGADVGAGGHLHSGDADHRRRFCRSRRLVRPRATEGRCRFCSHFTTSIFSASLGLTSLSRVMRAASTASVISQARSSSACSSGVWP